MKSLSNQAKKLQEQREWMRAYEQLKGMEEIVISSDNKEELSRQVTVSSFRTQNLEDGKRELSKVLRSWFLSLERERTKRLECELR